MRACVVRACRANGAGTSAVFTAASAQLRKPLPGSTSPPSQAVALSTAAPAPASKVDALRVSPAVSAVDALVVTKPWLNPAVSGIDVANVAELIEKQVLPQLSFTETVDVLTSFSSRRLRHEGVLLAGAWKTFKAPLVNTSSAAETARGTALAFRVVGEQRLFNDLQLLAIGVGRCIELAPHMSLADVGHVYAGLLQLDRRYFSLTEVAMYDTDVVSHHELRDTSENLDDVREGDPDYRGQPNLLDVLCAELEQQICAQCGTGLLLPDSEHSPSSERASTPFSPSMSPANLLEILKGIASSGIQNPAALAALSRTTHSMKFSPALSSALLTEVAKVYTRVIDVLDYDANMSEVNKKECWALFSHIATALNVETYKEIARHQPQLILSLRGLCEKYPDVLENVPELWDRIRCLRVSHKHSVPEASQSRPKSKLFTSKQYALKAKRTASDHAADAQRFTPVQFRSRPDNTVRIVGQVRQRQGKQPQRMGFGTHRIAKNYVRKKQRKYLPAPS